MTKILMGVTRKQAQEAYPTADKIVKVEGGYLICDTYDDYLTWRRQR